MSNEPTANALIRSYVDRIGRLMDIIDEARDDIADVLKEARSSGFSPAAVRKTVKRSRETSDERTKREELESLTDLYTAAIGMLGGTPLGEAARRRMSAPPSKAGPDDKSLDTGTPTAAEPASGITPQQVEEARARGKADAETGKKILDNPYTAGDPRRAAWDEGHCEHTGSTGMDLPAAWRPKKPPGGGKKGGE